jgi:uncharacterized membrane protein YcgQ (UPF0703/DUF1980 family)
MRHINDKAKKLLIIAGCCVMCVALVIAIGARFQVAPQTADMISSSSLISSMVTPAPNLETSSTSSIQSADSTSAASTTQSSKTNQTNQKLQPDVSKPVTQSDSEVKNKTSFPKSTSSSSQVQGGETKDGKIYIQGFGWIDNNGGGGSGTTASEMYENGNKIGNMN